MLQQVALSHVSSQSSIVNVGLGKEKGKETTRSFSLFRERERENTAQKKERVNRVVCLIVSVQFLYKKLIKTRKIANAFYSILIRA